MRRLKFRRAVTLLHVPLYAQDSFVPHVKPPGRHVIAMSTLALTVDLWR